jgi:hypothetical protein
MTIWDSIRIEKVRRHHLCNLPEPSLKVNISIFYTSGLKFKDDNIIHKWLKMSTLCRRGLKDKNIK